MSRLPLTERLQKPMRQPKELASWSTVGDEHYNDSRALRYYYFPTGELKRNLNLITGVKGFDPVAVQSKETHLDGVLKTLIDYEKTNGRVDAQVITWRGILTQILLLAIEQKDELEFNIVHFDGQIFMEIDYAFDQAKKAGENYPNMNEFMYAGYNFEKFVTLEKPWGQSSRQEIEGRYKGSYVPGTEYGVLLRSGVGSIKVVYGAEVDCVEGDKDPKNPLSRYVELKTTGAITHPNQAKTLEKKFLRSWLQCFLAGIPKVVYGFRNQQFELQAVEEYPTQQLPSMVKNSKVTPPEERWNGTEAIGFYAVFLAWLKDTVKPDETYKLRYRKGADYLELVPQEIKCEGRKVAFLDNDFVAWREQARAEA